MVAHAFGARYDSPVPLALFVLGGAVVVLLSFAVVYRREVADDDSKSLLEDVIVPPRAGAVASAASVLALALLVLAGLFGSQEVPENILPTMFWVVGWVAVPLSVGVLGDWTGPANPFAAISRAAGTPAARRLVLGRAEPLGWSPRAAWWISAGVYALVVVGELIVNGVATLPRVTAVALVAYALVCAAGGITVGADGVDEPCGDLHRDAGDLGPAGMVAVPGSGPTWLRRWPRPAVRARAGAGGGCSAAAGFCVV
jgi:hypothetical protein